MPRSTKVLCSPAPQKRHVRVAVCAVVLSGFIVVLMIAMPSLSLLQRRSGAVFDEEEGAIESPGFLQAPDFAESRVASLLQILT